MRRTDFGKRTFCALLSVLLLFSLSPQVYADTPESAEHTILENLPFSVDGSEPATVKTLHFTYANNRYVSLRDFAAALIGTPKHFALLVEDGSVTMSTGTDYVPVGGEGQPFPKTDPETGASFVFTTQSLAHNPILLDGRSLCYLTFLSSDPTGIQDCFMSLTDLAMQLNLDLAVSSDGMQLNTAGHYSIDLSRLREESFYYEIHSALLGDAATGSIYAAWEPDLSVPIASTTKLMSFLILMDAVRDGEISVTDIVKIPEEAARLSRSEDGVIPLDAGAEAVLSDLLYGMLLPSSNECALTLAIHTAGSEEAFVERMNRKAKLLGLSDGAVFFNCHGLPVYTDNLPATKIQNRMSARDMFTLVCHLLKTCPEITDYTSLKSAELKSLQRSVENTNPLLFNLPGVVGLKTGTTNMSGDCLVSAVEAEDAQGERHILVAVEFGAEDNSIRTTFSEELLRYGLQVVRGESVSVSPSSPAVPTDAEELIQMILRSF